jgi:hypothetical protein
MPTRLEEFVEQQERRRQKIATLLDLLRDPDLADVVAKLVEETPRPNAEAINVATNGNGNGHHVAAVAGLPSGATEAIRMLGPYLPRPFTIHDVIEQLDARGYKYARDKKADVVRDAIYFMMRGKNNPFRVVKRGEHGALSTYEYREGPAYKF